MTAAPSGVGSSIRCWRTMRRLEAPTCVSATCKKFMLYTVLTSCGQDTSATTSRARHLLRQCPPGTLSLAQHSPSKICSDAVPTSYQLDSAHSQAFPFTLGARSGLFQSSASPRASPLSALKPLSCSGLQSRVVFAQSEAGACRRTCSLFVFAAPTRLHLTATLASTALLLHPVSLCPVVRSPTLLNGFLLLRPASLPPLPLSVFRLLSTDPG